MIKYRLFFAACTILLISSCKDKFDEEAFSTELEASFTSQDSSANTATTLYAVYEQNNYKPFWLAGKDKDATKKAEQLVKDLEMLQLDGIPQSRYDIKKLQKWIGQVKDKKGNPDTKTAIEFEKAFTEVYIDAANDLMYGISDPEKADDMWYHDNDTVMTANAYYEGLKITALDNFRSKLPTYVALTEYSRSLNNLENINRDSMRTVINVNLERLRWLPQSFEHDYVLVLVPKMEIFLKEDDSTRINMRAVVGKPERETPSLNADMVNIVFNPSWGVPPGIMKKDVIPGMLSKGPAYLKKKQLKIYDRKGNEVDANKVNADNYKQYVFRQPPSERNALGQVKFDMPNAWAIYLHDTPSKGDFELDERYKSSGCVRLQRPRELADYILTEMNNDSGYDREKIDEIVSTNKTEYVQLKHKLPVHIVYLTAYKDDNGKLLFYPDIYSKDNKVAGLIK